MDSDDEMAAVMIEDSDDYEDFYDDAGDGEDDSDTDGVVIDYDGFVDPDSDDSDDLSSSHHYHHRSQVISISLKLLFVDDNFLRCFYREPFIEPGRCQI